MDGEKGEFEAFSGSLVLDQKGEFKALRSRLSLDLNNCKLHPNLQQTNGPHTDPTIEQKQYAQGFFDALRAVQQLHNFEFEKKVLSPGFIAPIVGTAEFLTPLISPSSRDYQAILNAMVAKTPIMQPVVGTSTSSTSGTGFSTAMSTPETSSTATPSTSATATVLDPPILRKVEIKQETMYTSEDSTESDRSRSSSAAVHHIRPLRNDSSEIVMDEQEKRKLDRKRARNRAAATKCRQKKIDRIQDLERMVANEKQRSQNLDMEMENLRSALHQLQQLIQMHEQRGCARS